jgi:Transcriptional regulator, AbiEi antitoxin/Protein of unknown function (DUF559)
MEALARLSTVAGRQFGCFTRGDAAKLGVSEQQLRRFVRAGVIARVGVRVFCFSASGQSWHQRVMAACLDGGPDCVSSHRTAAVLHHVDGFSPGPVEILVPMHVRHRRMDVIVHHTRDLPAVDRTKVGPIPVTTLARTMIDLGAVVPATTVEEALDCAQRDGALKQPELVRRYESLRAPGRNGIGAMTQIIGARDALRRLPRSVLERRMRRLFGRSGLPAPIPRFKLRIGDRTYELDFATPGLFFDVEVDGHGSHATRKERAQDAIREADIENAGWTVRRFTYEQVMYEPDVVLAKLRETVRALQNRL